MRATRLEFRFRLVIIFAIAALGFWSPWVEAWNIGSRTSLVEWLALEVSRLGAFSFTSATSAVIVLATIVAAIGAFLRTWGTAWLGSGTVNSLEMRAGRVMADGPYRCVRNPLYLGTWFTIGALAFAMPAVGALFCMLLLSAFLLRLIFAEEAFLGAQLGEPYAAYVQSVPRLLPRLRSNLPPTGHTPNWGRSLVAETHPIGVLLITAILSWRYNNTLMLKAILINFGIALVIRAFLSFAPGDTTPGA